MSSPLDISKRHLNYTVQKGNFVQMKKVYRFSEKCLESNLQGFGNEVAERSTLKVF
jgi:hypothetical protein